MFVERERVRNKIRLFSIRRKSIFFYFRFMQYPVAIITLILLIESQFYYDQSTKLIQYTSDTL